MGVAYASSDQRGVDARFSSLQIASNQFINLPAAVGAARQNRDTLILTPGLRYGLSLNTEIYTRLSGVISDTRTADLAGERHRFTKKLNDAWLGINHRFSDDGDTPAFLGFLEIAFAENAALSGNDWSYGRSGLLGFTTYRTTDPIVLSLTSGYRYSRERTTSVGSVDPGDLLFLTPSVAFAVNNEVTLTAGFQWQWRQREVVDSVKTGINTTSSKIELGMGYAWSKQLTLQFNTRSDVTGDSGVQASLIAIYKILPSKDKFVSQRRKEVGME